MICCQPLDSQGYSTGSGSSVITSRHNIDSNSHGRVLAHSAVRRAHRLPPFYALPTHSGTVSNAVGDGVAAMLRRRGMVPSPYCAMPIVYRPSAHFGTVRRVSTIRLMLACRLPRGVLPAFGLKAFSRHWLPLMSFKGFAGRKARKPAFECFYRGTPQL